MITNNFADCGRLGDYVENQILFAVWRWPSTTAVPATRVAAYGGTGLGSAIR